ncbi:NADH:ubiquinone oxidoreductase subunit C [Streptomyces umbrinus]|uniref:NADH-quinone oxidoreductase subunit C n=1 Tax=Streptomyces umbrinus TaxID=67370 RepID=UPI00167C95AA|nr:NADH-quinone oxidoreductase subunit C [Streptomyces umbrinus]MCR3730278.1 NADH:ubiquinone oxidoreductase subunit C [Streptomyces umbrinus]GHH58479.1 dehydrogenase [Streptomyces umbrinus]
MTGWLPAPVEELFGPDTTAEESYEVLTVDVPPTSWLASLETARDELGCTYFDWLSAVDEPGTGFRVSAHVVALAPVRRLLVRTTVPHDAPVLPSAVEVYAGAAWHERETHEMFGVTFEGHPGLDPLLLPEGFEGHPLRKDFVLAARVAKAWPGAKEPGESEHGGPKRRQMLPPGVPDPNEWGPLKGQLPPAPARPARGTARAAGDRPVRRARTAGEGSASQAAAPGAATGGAVSGGVQAGAGGTASPEGGGAAAEARPTARRARSVSEGSATQRRTDPPATGAEAASAPAPAPAPAPASETAQAPAPTTGVAPSPAEGTEAAPASEPAPASAPTSPRRARTAGEGSASQRQAPATPATPDAPAPPAAPSGDDQPTGPARPRSSDAPWHHARPAFDEADKDSATERPPPTEQPAPEPESTPESEAPEPSESPEADSTPSPSPSPSPTPDPTPTDDENPPGGRQ